MTREFIELLVPLSLPTRINASSKCARRCAKNLFLECVHFNKFEGFVGKKDNCTSTSTHKTVSFAYLISFARLKLISMLYGNSKPFVYLINIILKSSKSRGFRIHLHCIDLKTLISAELMQLH